LNVPFLHPVFSFANPAGALPLDSYFLRTITVRTTDDVIHFLDAMLSARWVGAAAAVQYVFPDLSTVAGFTSDFQLFDRTPIQWNWGRTELNGMAGDGRISRTEFANGTTGVYCGNGIVEPPETCEPPGTATCSATCMKL
jgi:hypothetical protein